MKRDDLKVAAVSSESAGSHCSQCARNNKRKRKASKVLKGNFRLLELVMQNTLEKKISAEDVHEVAQIHVLKVLKTC